MSRSNGEYILSDLIAFWSRSDNVCTVAYLNQTQTHGNAMPVPRRFWTKVREDERGCWLWQSNTLRGYGQIGLSRNGGRQRWVLAHRVAWELVHGVEVPAGMVIRHRCDVSLCVNPAHLLLGTPLDNVNDQKERHRLTFGRSPLPPAGLRQEVVQDQALQPQQRGRARDQRSNPADLDAKGAIDFLGLSSPYALYRRIQRQGLPAHRVGGNWTFRADELRAWQAGVLSRARIESDSAQNGRVVSQ